MRLDTECLLSVVAALLGVARGRMSCTRQQSLAGRSIAVRHAAEPAGTR